MGVPALATQSFSPPGRPVDALIGLAPGLALSAGLAVAAYLLAPLLGRLVPIPAMVIALLIGIAVNPFATGTRLTPGLAVCVKSILRWAVALLGVRVGLADIAALGAGTAILIVAAMAVTIVSGFVIARWSGQPAGYGALAGVGTGVCGASATLAVSTVVPDYPGKSADIAFVVVAVNALATLSMLLYPPLCVLLGFDAQAAGVMLGGTIHDVAQVAGAGFAMSETVGTAAVIVKLFRVFLLLPVVLAVGVYFARVGGGQAAARVPVPGFALAFLALCVLNSTVVLTPPDVAAAYAAGKSVLVTASNWGLLLAIAALGLSTSVREMIGLGWRHMMTVLAATAVILVVVTGGLWLMNGG